MGKLYRTLGASQELAPTLCSVSPVFLDVLSTALGLYDKLARHAGAGTLVPITGFANSIAFPAIEFKSDVRCIIRIVRETRNRRVSGLNPTYFIGKEILEAAIIPHDFRLPQSQMDLADPSGSSFLRSIIAPCNRKHYTLRLTGRMDILFENKELYGGLHCGTAMEVLINGK